MNKPSELKENEAICIRGRGGAIGFHRYYGQLDCFALNRDGDPQDGRGVAITNDEEQADKIYEKWAASLANCHGITITHYDKFNKAVNTQVSTGPAPEHPEDSTNRR